MGKFFTKSNVALLLLIIIWGVSWPIYKLAVPYTPPLLFAGMRALIGGLLLAAFLFNMRSKINWREKWPKYCISALLNSVLFFGLQTFGLIYLPGGLLSVLVYFQPVLLGLFAWIWLGEKMSPIKIMGLLIGFLGIVVVSVDGLTIHISAIGVILGLLTALSWALGVTYVKLVSSEVDAFWMVALQSIIGGVILTATGTIFESWTDIVWNDAYLFGLGYGAIFGTALAFVIYYKLVNAGEASKIASFTFLVPIISVFTGTVFLGESATYTLIIGLLLVVISIYFVNYPKKMIDTSLFNKAKGNYKM
ncbi:DMT family transporter [Bacillus sp. FJAT-29790]|uniref:DMT family transporter n=1 Tax=Bacillus sp. FJAT-29790 TaxID=1895002 RepID=UPI001C24CB7A|nr:DMT family transporter [Bacillus sp. FJAT-29790]MBU8880879.1 DMT family transporter [Bacillus sp. FJAT-29790]